MIVSKTFLIYSLVSVSNGNRLMEEVMAADESASYMWSHKEAYIGIEERGPFPVQMF